MDQVKAVRQPTLVPPGGGRVYAMGRMRSIFKADNAATAGQYSVSEWWLEPRSHGAPLHAHSEDHVYYILAGTLSVQVDGNWMEAPAGSYVLLPGGTPHSFENRGAVEAGFITFNTPGGFETRMPDIAAALSSEDLAIPAG